MEETFLSDANITAMCDALPIRFVHQKSMDMPGNHVLHLNHYVEIYIYVSGNHNYIVENALYELKRGDIIVINPREVHKALPMQEDMYERFYILVDEHAFDSMYLNPLSQILNKPADMGNLISLDSNAREEVLDMLYEISKCFQEGRDNQLRAFGYLLQIIDKINQQLSRAHSNEGNTTHTPELLKEILTYVAIHTAEIQSITEISSALGLTPQYLSSYFSKHIGTPLKTYIRAKKIAIAKVLLDKGADVTQACYECGFNDCSYFIRIFKKYVGLTPMAYKKRLQK